MSTYFNLNRIGLLIQRYFIERFRSEILYWTIMAIVFMLIHNNLIAIGIVIFIGGIFYAAKLFREIHSTANGICYFMIPATQLEKITVSVFFATIYYFAMMVIAYIIGNLLGTCLTNLLAQVDFFSHSGLFHHSPLTWTLFEPIKMGGHISFTFMSQTMPAIGSADICVWRFFKAFLIVQSVFVLGGIWFKKSQASATILALTVFGFISGLVWYFELRFIISETVFLPNNIINGEFFSHLLRIFHTIMGVFLWLLAPFLWIVSYFRLTEKEV